MKYKPKKEYKGTCPECGKVFCTTIKSKTFCSDDCRKTYTKQHSKEKALRKWKENPVYCGCCGELVPFGRKKYCSDECQLEMKRREARVTGSETGEKKIRKRQKKEPGIEGKAKELGMSYGQYRANRGIKPVDIEEKFNAPAYEPEKWLGDDQIKVHQPPPGGPARIKRHVI